LKGQLDVSRLKKTKLAWFTDFVGYVPTPFCPQAPPQLASATRPRSARPQAFGFLATHALAAARTLIASSQHARRLPCSLTHCHQPLRGAMKTSGASAGLLPATLTVTSKASAVVRLAPASVFSGQAMFDKGSL
jgi:hypothetical protein